MSNGDAPEYVERWTQGTGGRLRYFDNAPTEPTGLPVLFSPGLTDTADEYVQLLETFSPRRVVVVEVRGRGRSDAPPTGYRSEDHTDDLEAVLAAAGIDRFHLMTFSRGTTWGLRLALRHPERVASISIGDYLAIEMGLPDSFAAGQWQSKWRGRPMPDRVEYHVLEGIQTASRHEELWAALGGLGIPVLVGCGSDGGILRGEHLERYRSAVPGVEVVTFAGATHDLFRPDRTAYPRAVAEFIARRGLDDGAA